MAEKKKERIWDPQQNKFVGERVIGQDLSVEDKAQLTKPMAKAAGVSSHGAPEKPDTSKMSLGDAAKANMTYKKAVDAWLAKQTPAAMTAGAQSKALKKKEQ